MNLYTAISIFIGIDIERKENYISSPVTIRWIFEQNINLYTAPPAICTVLSIFIGIDIERTIFHRP